MSKWLLHCLRISTKRPYRGGTLVSNYDEILVYRAYTEAVFEKLRYRIAETLILAQSEAHYGAGGVEVGGPYLLYVCSICDRISLRLLPSSIIFITSRVMPMQMLQARLMRSNIRFVGVELSLR